MKRLLLVLLLSLPLAAQPSLPNLRDVGGLTTESGRRVRTGLVFRCDQLYHVDAQDRQHLEQLHLKKIFDLRTEGERKLRPDEVPAGAQSVVLDVRAGEKSDSLAEHFDELMANPEAARQFLGDGRGEARMLQHYRNYVSSPSARAAFGGLFRELAQADNLPALYHCTAGKDRTGWGTAALLLLLGVPEEEVMRDYLRSNELELPRFARALEGFRARGGNPELWTSVLGVRREYLQAALDEMSQKYGGIEDYFTRGLGLDETAQERLRERFLEASGN